MLVSNSKNLVKGIEAQNSETLNYLYRKVFPRVKKYIVKNGGDYDSANDIFQEAIILVYRKAKSKELEDVNNVEAYIQGICRIIWINELKKNTISHIDLRSTESLDETEEYIYKEFQQSRRKKLFYEHFLNLHDDCKGILNAYFAGKSFADIAKEFNLISEEYARRKKYLCKEYLVKSIKSDPQYNKLIGEYDDGLFEKD
ncbi:MAG TPA: sigma-70 family RNA polymerase sigma factor [Tenuifilaceae bacterium]|nr:sigma-70 family RNA polymerase sigma factor [Tenuifilaceae bacterium]